jgi:hypothetical protein
VAEVFGLEVEELPDHWQPVEVLVIVECLDLSSEEGGPAGTQLSTRASRGMVLWKALGMAEAASADLKQQYTESLGEP